MFDDIVLHVVMPFLNGFIFELMVCATMFVHDVPRRRGFAWRLPVCVILLIVVTAVTHYESGFISYSGYGTSMVAPGTWMMAMRFALLYIGLFLTVRACFVLEGWQSVFVTVAAVSMQHFVYCVTLLVVMRLREPWSDSGTWEGSFVFLAISAMMGVIGYLLFARRLHGTLGRYVGGPRLLLVFIGVTLCVDIMSCCFDGYAWTGEVSDGAYALMLLTRVIVCVFVLMLLDDIVNREQAERDDAMLRGMLIQQKAQLDSDKATIDLINVKAHDIKRQLSLLGNRISPQEIDELSHTIGTYDASVRTGNEALDVLLTSRALICEQRGIAFERIVDGSKLSFMSPTDIYSLVGNALDNAIEAVDVIEDRADRYISLVVREDRGMLLIHMANPYVGELSFDDGLPRSTKGDDRYHGFGMRSMRMIAERYDGTMSVRAEDGVFRINIVLPAR